MISVEYVQDPSSTRLAAHPAPEVFLEEVKPTIGKTMEYQVYMEPTHAHAHPTMNVPEPTRYQPKDYPYNRRQGGGGLEEEEYDRHDHQEPYEDEYEQHHQQEQQEEHVPAKTVRRTITPGIKPPVKPARKWIW